MRIILLLILLAAACVWGMLAQRKSATAPGGPPVSPQVRVEEHEGLAVRVMTDFPYRFEPLLMARESTVDMYLPEGGERPSILVYIHGGGWIGGDKSGIGKKARSLAASGLFVASVNYRLAPMGPSPNACDDIAMALAFIRRTAEQVDADPDRIVLMGHSAGAHLAALVVSDPRYLERDPAARKAIRGVVLLDGSAYDVPAMMLSERGEDFINVFGQDRAMWLELSPYHHALEQTGLPSMLLVHAGDDLVREAAAYSLAEAVLLGGSRAICVAAPDKDHYSVDEDLSNPDEPLTIEVMRFIEEVLR